MPFAGFDDWNDCMRTMTDEEGHDEGRAESICGALQAEAKSDHGNVEELMEALDAGRGLIADVGVDLVSGVDRPAIDSKWVMLKSADTEHDYRVDAPILLGKAEDTDRRLGYAPAMIPREPDKEGDVVATPTVERAAHKFLKNDGGIDTDHDLIDGEGEPVESWVLKESREFTTPDGGREVYPAGTWMLGVEWGKEAWDRIQSGELTGLSIYGMADHVELGKAADEGAADGEPGATPKSDAEESSKQESPMSDSESVEALENRLETVESSVEDVADTVETIKEAVDTDKEPGEGGDGNAIRDLAAELANHEDVSASAEDIMADLKADYLSDKADDEPAGDGMGDNDGEEDDEDEQDGKAAGDGGGGATETEKADATPNYGKGADGSDAAATAKDAQGAGGDGVPSYAAAADAYEEDK